MGHELCPWSSRIRRGPNDLWSPFPEGAVVSCDVETRLPWPCMDLRSLGGFWNTSSLRRGSCVKLAQRKNPPYGKKKAARASVGLQTDTLESAAFGLLANTCEGAARRLRSPRPTDSQESIDAVRSVHHALAPARARPFRGPSLGSPDVALG